MYSKWLQCLSATFGLCRFWIVSRISAGLKVKAGKMQYMTNCTTHKMGNGFLIMYNHQLQRHVLTYLLQLSKHFGEILVKR
jgi:hypothetical protein